MKPPFMGALAMKAYKSSNTRADATPALLAIPKAIAANLCQMVFSVDTHGTPSSIDVWRKGCLVCSHLTRLVQPLLQLLGGQLLVLRHQIVGAADAVALWQAASRGISRGSDRLPDNTQHFLTSMTIPICTLAATQQTMLMSTLLSRVLC